MTTDLYTYTTTAGVELTLQPISMLELTEIKTVELSKAKESGLLIEPPTYTVKVGDHLQNGLYMVRVNTSMGTYTQTLIYGVK